MKTTVVGIDPGLANTAVVVLEDGRVTVSKTIATKGEGPRPSFESVMARGLYIAREVADTCDPLWNVTAVAIEGYEDFGGGHLRTREGKPIPNRWTTPAVCALLGQTLISRNYPVVWQRASVVMRQYGPYKAAWRKGQRGVVPGDSLVTNDHERSALCHALAWMDAHKIERLTS